MIIWRGSGFLVLAIVFACSLAANFLAVRLGGEGFWNKNGWPFATALATAAVVLWFLGRRMNKPARKDSDPRRSWTHDFFFVRMEWWAFPLVAVAIGVFVTGWKPGNSPRAVKAAVQQAEKLATPGK